MGCITTTSFSVIVNGIPGEPFGPERSIRHRDVISPHIFIVSVEYLRRY